MLTTMATSPTDTHHDPPRRLSRVRTGRGGGVIGARGVSVITAEPPEGVEPSTYALRG
jgi:hypothetical protein